MKQRKSKLTKKRKSATAKFSVISKVVGVVLVFNAIIALGWVGFNSYCLDNYVTDTNISASVCSVSYSVLNSGSLQVLPVTGGTDVTDSESLISLFIVLFLASLIEMAVVFVILYPISKGIKHLYSGRPIQKVY